jgi:hypothetical protein
LKALAQQVPSARIRKYLEEESERHLSRAQLAKKVDHIIAIATPELSM